MQEVSHVDKPSDAEYNSVEGCPTSVWRFLFYLARGFMINATASYVDYCFGMFKGGKVSKKYV